jgi:hypothetical protein
MLRKKVSSGSSDKWIVVIIVGIFFLWSWYMVDKDTLYQQEQNQKRLVAPKSIPPPSPKIVTTDMPLKVDYARPFFVGRFATPTTGYDDYPNKELGKASCQIEGKTLAYPITFVNLLRSSWTFAKVTGCSKPVWVQDSDCEVLPLSDEVKKWPNNGLLPNFNIQLPSVIITPEIESGSVKNVSGEITYNNQIGGFFDLIATYQSHDPKNDCILKANEQIKAVARAPVRAEGKLSDYILVVSRGCPKPVWVDRNDFLYNSKIKFSGNKSNHIDDLPLVKLQLARPSPAPLVEPELPPIKTNLPRIIKKVYVRTETGDKHPWHSLLPPEISANDPENADLLITIRLVPELAEEACTYGMHGAVFFNQSKLKETVVARLSMKDLRKVIAVKTFTGTPGICLNQTVLEQGLATLLPGNPPKPDAFVEWIKGIVKAQEKQGQNVHRL